MSLAYNASPWINDTPEQQSQKRTPTIRKTIKKLQMPKPEYMAKSNPNNTNLYNSNIAMSSSTYISEEQDNEEDLPDRSRDKFNLNQYDLSPNMANLVEEQDKTHDKVHEILKKMNQQIQIENDGGNLANFRPLENNERIVKKSETIPASEPVETDWNQMLKGIKVQQGGQSFSSSSGILGKNDNNYTAEYHNAYNVPTNVNTWARGSGGQPVLNTVGNTTDQRLLDKINYMIHLLEEQQNEKTNNSLEEFVMFSLIGVFIIYVLDSFSRTARYTR